LQGNGKTIIRSNPQCIINWNKGDVFVLPYEKVDVVHISFENDTIIFTVDDSPLLTYLGCNPTINKFLPTHFKNHDMMKAIENCNNENGSENRNRNGVLLTTEYMMKENLNTITHTMWSLYNFISPNTVQKPHRHNSVAIDLCIDVDEEASNKCLVYTLMGKSINNNNEIIDPIKMVWKKHHCFTTPPGWWHSHHNNSDKPAWVFPIQDAGLHTYMQTLDISFNP
jgi:gentisate 1,2-dioxygenase